MSISAFIQNPQNYEEESFSIAAASENTFAKKWEPIIEELQLQWIPLFSSGIDLEEIDLKDVLAELNQFKSAYIDKYVKDEVIDRADFLSNALKKVFNRAGLKVFIGKICS